LEIHALVYLYLYTSIKKKEQIMTHKHIYMPSFVSIELQ